MDQKKFTIKKSNDIIILEKENQKITIHQAPDNDIYFATPESELAIELKLSSRDHHEWQTYLVFESLMKSIIGHYILSGDWQKEYSSLPKDFINLEKKVIIWHSDSSTESSLKLEYLGNTIKVSLVKDAKFKENSNTFINIVRIRTSGSEYGSYYQEFIEFFRKLSTLERQLNRRSVTITKEINKEQLSKKLTKNPRKKF